MDGSLEGELCGWGHGSSPLQCSIPLEVHSNSIKKFKSILFLCQTSLPWESFESIDEALILMF